jgi:hypothetical protein
MENVWVNLHITESIWNKMSNDRRKKMRKIEKPLYIYQKKLLKQMTKLVALYAV